MREGHGPLGGHMAGTWLQGESVLISLCVLWKVGSGEGLFLRSVL